MKPCPPHAVRYPAVRGPGRSGCRAFTLIEILAATLAFALLLTAVYSLFSHATRLRDRATIQTREVRLQARAVALLREDLRNATVSGGRMAAELRGSIQSPRSRFPGYLRFTTATGWNQTNALFGDLQEVEYFVVNDPFADDRNAGLLVRTVDRNLLAIARTPTAEEAILSGVRAFEVSFLEGQNWMDSWEFTDLDPRLPDAVRVRLRLARSSSDPRDDRVIEVLVPWTVRPIEIEAGGQAGVAPGRSPSGFGHSEARFLAATIPTANSGGTR